MTIALSMYQIKVDPVKEGGRSVRLTLPHMLFALHLRTVSHAILYSGMI